MRRKGLPVWTTVTLSGSWVTMGKETGTAQTWANKAVGCGCLTMILIVVVATIAVTTTDNTKTVRQGDFKEWPFTVPEVELECIATGGTLPNGQRTFAAVARANNKTYPLNGIAGNGAAKMGWEPKLDPIWAPHPTVKGARVSAGPMIELALEACE